MPNAVRASAHTLTDLLFERGAAGFCLVAPDGTIVRANAEWLRSTGMELAEEQVVGGDVVGLLPGTRDTVVAMLARARAGHRVELPRRARAVGGRETWWEGSIDPVPMEGGTGLLVTARELDAGDGAAVHQHAIAAAMARVFESALRAESEEDLGRACLAVAEEVTGSAFGFIGAVQAGTGRLDDIAISDPGWDACRMTDPAGHGKKNLIKGFAIHGIYGRVLRDGATVLTNDPLTHPDRIGTPAGHPALRSFLGVPLVHAGETWGMVAVGNRPGGYGANERAALEALAPAIVQAFMRQRAEQAVREQRAEAERRAALVEAVLDCIGDGVIVYDRQGRTVRSSPAADAILQLPPSEREAPVAERVGRQYEIYAEDGRRLDPDEMLAVRAVRGETVRGALQQVRSGHHEPRWLLMSAMPLFVSGEHTGAVLSMTDITERKRAEAELATVTRLYAVLTRVNEAIVRIRDERSLYGELCRIVADGSAFPLVWVGLVEGRAVAPVASAGRAVEYLRDAAVEVDGPLGQGPTGTCIREDRPIINDDFALNPATWPWREATARHGLRASAAFPIRRDGAAVGAVTFYAGSAGAFTPQQVKLLESLCADISYALDALARERLRAEAETALRASERALREADRRKDEFLGMLSHELRNPLAPIRNSTYVLEHAAPGSEQARRAQAVIERQTGHLARLVDDLLDVTRIARGKIELRRSRVDLREIVARAGDDFRLLMHDRGVRYDVAIPEERIWADADPTRITQIVGNLLHNASKYTRRGDEVTLALEASAGEAVVRVHDTGAGIDPALLPRVFDAFVQGDRTLARSEGGLGLGLAMVKGIAELHGGSVHAESAGRGRGADFVVRLPLAASASPQLDAPARATTGGAARRVLIVDDNVDAALSMAEIVAMLGHAPDVAHDGPSALAKALAHPPEVVLCDLGLPGMSGYEVAVALRRAGTAAQLFAVSGYAQPEDVRRAIEAGFDGHVAKPCEPEKIERLLA